MTNKKQELVPVGSASGLNDLLLSRKDSLNKLATKHVTVDRLIKGYVVAASRVPALYKCTQLSILQTCIDAASLGLDLAPAKKHAAIIPFGQEATLIPMVHGYIEIAGRSGINIFAAIAYQLEVAKKAFYYTLGTNRMIYHAPLDAAVQAELSESDNPAEILGSIVYFYAVAEYPNGYKDFVVLAKREVDKIRNASRAKNAGPWVDWYEEMGKKTAIRRLFKTLRLTDEMADLVDVDDKGSGLDESLLVSGAEVSEEPSEDRAADLAGKLGKGRAEILPFPNGEPTPPVEALSEAETAKQAPEPPKEEKVAPEPSETPPAAKKRGRPPGAKNKAKADPRPPAEPPVEPTTTPEPPEDLKPEPVPALMADALIDSLRAVETEDDFIAWRTANTEHIGNLELEDKDLVQDAYMKRRVELFGPEPTPPQES